MQERKPKDDNKDSMFLNTAFHQNDHSIREIVHQNLDILGQSTNTASLYQKKLVVGYWRAKNLRDMLMNAGIQRTTSKTLTLYHQ